MPVKQTILKRPSASAASAATEDALFRPGKVDKSLVHKATTMTKEQWQKHQEGMDDKWPLPDYMGNSKGHTHYRDETYTIITRWTADTKIAYRPHAKSPGSKSHLRYEQYSRAKTVGEAYRLGSYPGDWCWDFERGFIKVLGGHIRDEPLDVSKCDESEVTPVDKVINSWYVKELAKMLGMKASDIAKSTPAMESALIRALRLLAQKEAKERLERADHEGRLITDEEVLLTLKRWPFYRNPWRKNVMQGGKTWVFSDTLGLLRDRQGDVHLTAPTRRYPQVAELFARYLTERLPDDAKTFTFTSMNLNCNYAAAMHRDNGNWGPSFIKAFGDFSGGNLNYWSEDAGGDLTEVATNKKHSFDLAKGLALFNGNCAHSVDPFEGSRYSIVWFTVGCHGQAKAEDRKKMQQLGIPMPGPKSDPYDLLRPPRGYDSKAPEPTPAKGGGATYRFYDDAFLQKTQRKLEAKSAAEVKKLSDQRLQPENARSFYSCEARRARREAEGDGDEMEY